MINVVNPKTDLGSRDFRSFNSSSENSFKLFVFKSEKIPSEMEAAPRYKLPVHSLQLTMLTRGGRGDRDNFPKRAK